MVQDIWIVYDGNKKEWLKTIVLFDFIKQRLRFPLSHVCDNKGNANLMGGWVFPNASYNLPVLRLH
jgi:hypothetical protein